MNKFENNLMKVFAEYDNDFILGAYKELLYLRKTGSFPVGQKYFIELCDVRHRLYESERSLDDTKRDLLDEIARRWALIQESENNG